MSWIFILLNILRWLAMRLILILLDYGWIWMYAVNILVYLIVSNSKYLFNVITFCLGSQIKIKITFNLYNYFY